MITSFSFDNFGPFSNKQTIDFCSIKNIKTHNDSLIDSLVLPTICFYGPNGGGKTTLIFAIKRFFELVTYNLNFNGSFSSNYSSILESINYFDKSKPINFEINFYEDDFYYTYLLSIENNVIIKEKYFYKKGNKNKKEFIIFDKENDILSIEELNISKLSTLNINKEICLFSSIANIVSNVHLNNFVKLLKKFNFAEFANLYNLPWSSHIRTYMENNKERILNYFSDLDFNIIDYKFESTNPMLNTFAYESFWVLKEDSNFNKVWRNITLESRGTSKIILFIYIIDKVLNDGEIMIVDELDSSLHTSLLEYIIKLFSSKITNKNGAILLFNSHDLMTLDNSVFRKDEIYFSALDEKHTANIWRLSDFNNVRDKNSLYKMYKEGKFGADPYIKYSMEKFDK